MTLSRRAFLKSGPLTLAAPALFSVVPARAQSPVQNAGHGDIQRFFVGEIEVIALWDGYAQLRASMLAGFDPSLAETAA